MVLLGFSLVGFRSCMVSVFRVIFCIVVFRFSNRSSFVMVMGSLVWLVLVGGSVVSSLYIRFRVVVLSVS